jgi:hypothetical protein
LSLLLYLLDAPCLGFGNALLVLALLNGEVFVSACIPAP